jgi:hypothetical protein
LCHKQNNSWRRSRNVACRQPKKATRSLAEKIRYSSSSATGAGSSNWHTFEGATFSDYHAVFETAQPCTIAARLKEILDEFGQQGHAAVFSVWRHDVAGFWVDPLHNYLGIHFSKASGDEFDGVLVNSIGG